MVVLGVGVVLFGVEEVVGGEVMEGEVVDEVGVLGFFVGVGVVEDEEDGYFWGGEGWGGFGGGGCGLFGVGGYVCGLGWLVVVLFGYSFRLDRYVVLWCWD